MKLIVDMGFHGNRNLGKCSCAKSLFVHAFECLMTRVGLVDQNLLHWVFYQFISPELFQLQP